MSQSLSQRFSSLATNLLMLSVLLAASIVSAQEVLSISSSTVSLSGGASITLYGTGFPLNEPTWIVFLATRYDLAPTVQCQVDTFKSTTARAVCDSLAPFPAAAAGNVSLYQVQATYYAGLKTTSSTQKYFFTSASVQVTTTVAGALLQTTPGVLATSAASLTVVAQLGGNVSADALFNNAGSVVMTLRETTVGSVSSCSLVSSQALSLGQLAGVSAAAPQIPFACATGMPAGFYSTTVTVSGASAPTVKSYIDQVLRFGPTLGEYATFVPPVVSGVSPSTVSTATNITFTIAGTGFSNTASDHSVSIGGTVLTVLSSSPTQIVCRGIPGVTTATSLAQGGAGALRRAFTITQAITTQSVHDHASYHDHCPSQCIDRFHPNW
ncbi:Hypothetical protein, putative [Bodo saltans]|uniref:IPT/TIG domain-containing protein n=1 Tax=Bodo saltans TaxID=75058 RepID=A0A0S4JD63_BODSA|nr:Hypothetical protein, putative [Bodo saltans]|eukprot:CUG88077.1 Hypothetical protein, putative [Bodo saltans]